jgi:hypothetical protein
MRKTKLIGGTAASAGQPLIRGGFRAVGPAPTRNFCYDDAPISSLLINKSPEDAILPTTPFALYF